MRPTPRSAPPGRQKGATLVIALLILVLIMMIGISAVSTSNTQYRLAGNLQFEDSALNNAEAAVTAAETWLATGLNHNDTAFTAVDPSEPSPTLHPDRPHLLPRTTVPSVRADRDIRAYTLPTWDDDNSLEVGGDNQRYYIELISQNNRLQGSSQVVGGRASSGCNQVNTYMITARGASARGAVKYVQSYYSVLNCPA